MPAGRPKGHPKTGGRAAGVPNKVTAEFKIAAQQYGPEALETLAQIMRHGDSGQVRVLAANSLLDRGFGRPSQTVDLGSDPARPVSLAFRWAEAAVAHLAGSDEER